MPIGYLVTVLVVAGPALLCVRPLRFTRWAARASWWLTFLPNEAPLLGLLWLAAATLLCLVQGDLFTPVGVVGLVVALGAAAGLGVVVGRARRTAGVLEEVAVDAGIAGSWRTRSPALRTVVGYAFQPRALERLRDVAYGPRPRQVLDVVRRRSGVRGRAPVFVYLHGGGFRSGRNDREGKPLQHRLALEGWLVVDADYRLWPDVGWHDQVDDVRAVLRWVRERADVDQRRIVVGGSSAGAHLAATVALTDFDVAGAVCLYGYYEVADAAEGGVTTPRSYRRPDAPPFVVVHGDQDTLTSVGNARSFVAELREVHRAPVLYAELPGAQHSFDVLHSIRFDRVVDFVAAYLGQVPL